VDSLTKVKVARTADHHPGDLSRLEANRRGASVTLNRLGIFEALAIFSDLTKQAWGELRTRTRQRGE
jgi:hypothetical protein